MLTLRPYRPEDAETIARFIADEDTFLWWSAGNLGVYPLRSETLSAYYAPHIAAGGWFPQTLEDDGKVAGHMLMRWMEQDARWLHFGFIVVDGAVRGRGYGSGMLTLALAHAFGALGAQRVTLNVFEANAPAIRCYERLGFARGEEWTTVIDGREMRVFRYEKTRENA